MTKEQRRKDYIKVANKLLLDKWNRGLCYHLMDYSITINQSIKYPEINLFIPFGNYREWWNFEDRYSRVNALLFAAEMCND